MEKPHENTKIYRKESKRKSYCGLIRKEETKKIQFYVKIYLIT